MTTTVVTPRLTLIGASKSLEIDSSHLACPEMVGAGADRALTAH
ncbi:MAG: hypothetical protein ACRDPM_04135 [Solirubrobacteraceae bacterium]